MQFRSGIAGALKKRQTDINKETVA